jgi:hypothetical protein
MLEGVVEIVTLSEIEDVPEAIVDGEKTQLAPDGSPEQENVTGAANAPFVVARLTVY